MRHEEKEPPAVVGSPRARLAKLIAFPTSEFDQKQRLVEGGSASPVQEMPKFYGSTSAVKEDEAESLLEDSCDVADEAIATGEATLNRLVEQARTLESTKTDAATMRRVDSGVDTFRGFDVPSPSETSRPPTEMIARPTSNELDRVEPSGPRFIRRRPAVSPKSRPRPPGRREKTYCSRNPQFSTQVTTRTNRQLNVIAARQFRETLCLWIVIASLALVDGWLFFLLWKHGGNFK